MAVEIGAACDTRPDATMIEHVAGPLMTAVMGCDSVAATVDAHDGVWHISWGSAASSQLVVLPAGAHEFGDKWFVSVAPGERGEDLSLLFSVIVGIAAAILHDGQIVDGLSLVGGEVIWGSDLLAKIFCGSGRAASQVLTVLAEKS